MKTLTIVLIIMGFCTDLFCQDFPDDFCLCEKQNIASAVLNEERLLFIYLPTGYYEDTTKTYPVHYVADAPATSNLYFDLLRFNALMNEVPQGIVVGLSSDGRNENFHFKKNAAKYFEFIKDEVIPFVGQNYRSNDYSVFAGHSAGGDFVFYAFLQNPRIFNAYIAGSPGPIEQVIDLVRAPNTDLQTGDYRFLYSSVGSYEDTDTLLFRALKKLLEEKAGKQHECHFLINQDENHISNGAINFQNGFRKLYENWKFRLPDSLEVPVSQLLQNHYNRIEEKFGYQPPVDEWEVIFPIMDELAKRGDFENAIDVLKYCIKLYPDSDQAYAFLAKAYFDTGKFEAGKIYLKRALEINPENKYAQRIKMMISNQ